MLCFWPLEPEKFERRVRDNADVDAAERYIGYPVCVQRANNVLAHALQGSIVYQ